LRAKARARKLIKVARRKIRRFYARAYRDTELRRQKFLFWTRQHRGKFIGGFLTAALVAAVILYKLTSTRIESFFASADLLGALRTLFVTLGGALVGATAIGFSVVMLAVQLNFARIPHGLFRRVTSDFKLIGAFAATFLLAGLVTAFSVIPDKSWAPLAVIASVYASVAVLLLFIYAYKRALALINPLVQLNLVYKEAERDLEIWRRRAQRLAPLIDQGNPRDRDSGSTHDTARILFFQANPHWTAYARRAVTYAVSFARRFSEQNDYDVSSAALRTVAALNAKYIEAKGRTFFASNAIIDHLLSRDAFISDTLEQLRLLSQTALTRRDEDQLRQTFAAFADLVGVYSTIDYANKYERSKHDATLSAGYLASAVENVAPHNLPDVLMEGVRQLGRSASVIMASSPDDATTSVQKIGQLACLGAIKENYRAVTVTGMEQLSGLTMRAIVSTKHDIGFAVKEIRSAIEQVTKLFLLMVPDQRFVSTHSSYLAPYYSLTKTGTFGEWLTRLANELNEVDKHDANAEKVIRHVKQWSEELYRSEKDVLLTAIEKRSHFTFDSVHWIAQVTKALAAIAQAAAADDHVAKEIEKNATWLLSVLSWVPDDREAVKFAEVYGITDQLFEVAIAAENLGSANVARTAREILLDWSIKVGKDQPFSLENGLRALALSTLFGDESANVTWLKAELPKALAKASLDQGVVDNAARQLRTTAASFRRRNFPTSRLEVVMQQVDRAKMQTLFEDIAKIASPGTASEEVEIDIF
jgi:hypothetical protein